MPPRTRPNAARASRRSALTTSRSNGDRRKLAEIVSQEIEREIAARGWPVGEVVGSEAELLERYGVSRAVLREAVRIVEHHFVATMRRGPGGGLVVTAPDIGAIVRAVALQLQFQHIQPRQLYEARTALELTCVREASERITREGMARLKAYMDEESRRDPVTFSERSHDFHALIAELTGNPALKLFVQILGRLTAQQSRYPASPQESDEVGRAHRRIGEAVLARDPDAAERRMQRHLEAITGWLGAPSEGNGGRRRPRRTRQKAQG
jgi:DNA-binding FadR family transcriptional regulator